MSQDGIKISVIVAIYNTEKYLRHCIDSILAQTYKNFELFLVDDGSSDNCGTICDEYAMADTRIRVMHQNNQGQSAARNHASKIATGDFITFVDSDDYIEPDYLEYLLELQGKYNSDMSVGGFCYLYEGKTPKERNNENETNVLLNPTEALIRMNYNQGFGAMACVKLIRRELVLKYPFPEGQIYEDLAIFYRIVSDCNSVALGNRRIYYWLQHVGSTMRKKFDEKQMVGMDVVAAQIKFVEKECPEALKSAKYRYTAKAIELLSVCFNSGGDRKIFQRLKKEVSKYGNEVLIDRRAKSTMKLRILAVMLGYRVAQIVFRIHEKAKENRKV